jgi:hypothetical protein
MAKKTKNEAPANTSTETNAPVIERGTNDLFKRVMEGGKGKIHTGKLAPQALVIMNTIEAAGDGGISRKDLVAALGDGSTGPLKTRQPAGRIVSYYQKALIASGAVVLEKQS